MVMFKSIRRTTLLIFFIIATFPIALFAQSRQKVDQGIEWFAVASTVKIHPKVGLYFEGQFRFVGDMKAMQHQFRTAVEITPKKKFSFVPLGYVYTWNYKYGEQPASIVNNEHRLWEQVMYKNHLGRVSMSHRIRLEQRFVESNHLNAEGQVVNNGHDFSNRARYRFLANVPLNHAAMEPKTIFACVYDEVFASFGKKVTYNEPDQNRIFVGLGYQFTKMVSVQGGFFHQTLIKSNGTKQENNTGFQLQLTWNFDCTQK